MVVVVPGPWAERRDFIEQVVTLEPFGRFMFAGAVLADIVMKDHIALELYDHDPAMAEAFAIAGQGRLPDDTLAAIAAHRSVAVLFAPLDLPNQRQRLLHFTRVLQRAGGIALKLDSTGIAHLWERWFALLEGNSFDQYCAVVTLAADTDVYYSCGMHHFGLPDCDVPNILPVAAAADLMNQFNYWQITERPELTSGHTFSLTATSALYTLELVPDPRFGVEDAMFNPYGCWQLRTAM